MKIRGETPRITRTPQTESPSPASARNAQRRIARREELRKAEQMKADTQRKAESAKAEERRTAESRRQEERKRAERRQNLAAKKRTGAPRMARPPSKRSVCDGNSAARQKTGTRPRRSRQSRTRDARATPISGGAQRQPSPNASSVKKRNSRRSNAGRRTRFVPCTAMRCTASKKTRTRPSRYTAARDPEHR